MKSQFLIQVIRWAISTELVQESLAVMGIYDNAFSVKNVGQGGYIQGQYNISPELQLMARYEHFYANKDDKKGYKMEASPLNTPHYFGYQHDTTIGFTYDISSNVKLQAEHHWYQGTARLTPLISPDTIRNDHEYWQLSAIQLTYWF